MASHQILSKRRSYQKYLGSYLSTPRACRPDGTHILFHFHHETEHEAGELAS